MNINSDSLSARLDKIESRIEIDELISAYFSAIDTHDAEAFLKVWAEEGRWVIGEPYGSFQGAEELASALESVVWVEWAETHHWSTNLTLDFSQEDRVLGVCEINCNARRHDGSMYLAAARFNDIFVRQQGKWLTLERNVSVFWMQEVECVSTDEQVVPVPTL